MGREETIPGARETRRKSPLSRWLFAVFCVSYAGSCLAAVNLANYERRLEKTTPPKLLFRWVSPHWLKQWKDNGIDCPLRLPEISSEGYVRGIQELLKIYSNRVAFTWIDPVLGSHGALHEHYGGEDALLMVFAIDPDASGVRFVHSLNDDNAPIGKSIDSNTLRGAGLIEHVTKDLHEWIIVDPKVIRAYTADPKITFPLWLQSFKPFFESPNYQPPLAQIHMRFNGDQPAWSESHWSKSIFFRRQFDAFAKTPSHPWHKKQDLLTGLRRREGAFSPEKVKYGDDAAWTNVICQSVVGDTLSWEQVITWWETLRK